MGQKCCKDCPLTKEDLDEYELLTFLTRSQIISAYLAFERLNPVAVSDNRDVRLACETVMNGNAELRQNPIGDRICHAFSSEKDGKLSFDDFLDMLSVMSDKSTPELKSHFAFQAYDFDGDGVIGRSDLAKCIDRFYHTEEKHLTTDEKKKIVDRCLEEVDVDKDGFICKPEFRFAISKCPDFFHNFKMLA